MSTGQSNFDKAYEEYGNYITQNQKSNIKNQNYNLKLKTGQDNNNLFSGGGSRFFVEGDIHEKDSNSKEKANNKKSGVDIIIKSFIHNLSVISSNLTANIKKNIAPKISNVNAKIFVNDFNGQKLGVKTISAKEPADKFIQIPDKTLYQDLEKNPFIKTTLAKESSESQLDNVVYYSFRSLFTGRKQEELEFKVEDTKDYFSFKSQIPADLVGGKLVIPALEEQEITEIDEGDFLNTVEKLPQIYLDGELVEYSSEMSFALPYIREGNLEIRVPKIRGYYSYNLPFDSTQGKQSSKGDRNYLSHWIFKCIFGILILWPLIKLG